MSPLREFFASFDSDDIGDAILLVLAVCGITAMLFGLI